MDRKEKVRKLANLLSEARNKVGVTQDKLAAKMGVSKRTIQNWESGESSVSFYDTVDYFVALGVEPLPYYKRYLFGKPLKNKRNRNELLSEAHLHLNEMTDHELECFNYIMSGSHGSSPSAYLQKNVADLQTPLGDRLASAVIVSMHYMNALHRGQLNNPDGVLPNMEVLNSAIIQAEVAYRNNMNSYLGYMNSKE